jgi:hypothetical protein
MTNISSSTKYGFAASEAPVDTVTSLDVSSESDGNATLWNGFCGTGGGGGPAGHHNKRGGPRRDDNTIVSDSELARRLQELSVKERNQLYEEIHGVASIPDEEPVIVETRLAQLDDEITRIRDKPAYLKALFLAPRRVKSRAFRMMFLRAAEFDPREAAARMVQHYENKLELFGESLLGKDITLEDLSEDDVVALQTGSTMFLPAPDMAGRGVNVLTRKSMNAKTLDNQVRTNKTKK